jgi:hypothetical protein
VGGGVEATAAAARYNLCGCRAVVQTPAAHQGTPTCPGCTQGDTSWQSAEHITAAAAAADVQSRGADPSLLTKETDSYLDPGRKGVLDVAVDDDNIRQQLAALNARYEGELNCPPEAAARIMC